MNQLLSPESSDQLSIAIIGMSCRLPGATNVEEFWQNLQNGVESVTFFSDEELESEGIEPALLSQPNYVKARAVLSDIEMFDASFFGFTPREAEIMEPQHRLFLECAWEALEHAGYNCDAFDGQIGVFAGAGMNTYLLKNLLSNPDLIQSLSGLQIAIGNDKDFVPTQVSYKLNLKGPSVNVNTACSSSLVTVQMGCQSLLNYECNLVMAGGVSVNVPQKEGYLYQQGSILSPDGHCRAFDANAQGCIDGSGVGIVVLKRLEDALADRDNILAVIKGSAINNDGSLKVSYTAPSVEGQAAVIAEAQAMAGIDVETINYIETHGTGTDIGDPIEIAALTQAFRVNTQKKGFCAIASVKTNIGHLGAAAGVAGLIKTVLALKYKQIPPSLHYEQPNPKINFAKSPFYVNTKLSEWKTDGTPRRAGVSSFGIGGTNCHLILEEAPLLPVETNDVERPLHILTLSAKSEKALKDLTQRYQAYLQSHPEALLADVCFTANTGRSHFEHRLAAVAESTVQLTKQLSACATEKEIAGLVKGQANSEKHPKIAFLFTGQGSQYIGMGRLLYETQPSFRAAIDRADEILRPYLEKPLLSVLYPATAENSLLNQTAYTQPALFALEYALFELWKSWGITPNIVMGHSLGEYVAACVAGVFSLEDGLRLVAERSRLMQSLPQEGEMVAVFADYERVASMLAPYASQVVIASVNGSENIVISGAKEAVKSVLEQLKLEGITAQPLQVSHAFHSPLMNGILDDFERIARQVQFKAPSIPLISNLTGQIFNTQEIPDASYWCRHLRQPVQFAAGMNALSEQGCEIFLEIGPGDTLLGMGKRCLPKGKGLWLPSLKQGQDNWQVLLKSLGSLEIGGVNVDWAGFDRDYQRRLVHLPTYPFERQRYWIEPGKPTDVLKNDSQGLSATSLTDKKTDIADWFYIPSWKRSLASTCKRGEMPVRSSWLIFIDECGLGSQLVKRLEEEGHDAITVKIGSEFTQIGEGSPQKFGQPVFTINPRQSNDYNALVSQLLAMDKMPTNIVHLWSVTPDVLTESKSSLASVDKAQDLGFYSLLFLTQALGKHNYFNQLQITVVSNNIQEVTGEEVLCPEKATVLGAIKVIPQEYRNITCRSVDVVLPKIGEKIIDQLLAEIAQTSSDLALAYRGNHRWVQTFEPVQLNKSDKATPRLREGGVYLITGGLGGIGLLLAEYLAKTFRAKLILTGRSALPAPAKWEQWLTDHDENDSTSYKIRKLQELEQLGAEVLPITTDVADRQQMQDAIAIAQKRFGQLNGVIHAAGIVEGNSIAAIAQIDKTECEVQFQPKIRGTLVLESILEKEKLDFCLLMSSLSPILGGLAFVAYGAANTFMDVFVRQHNQKSSIPWIAVNWEGWQFSQQQSESTSFNANVPQLEMTPQEGLEVFERILAWGEVDRLVVSTGDLQQRIDRWIKLESLPEAINSSQLDSFLLHHARPNLSNAYLAPRNQIEQKLADIWQQLLGIEQVGIYDNFLELGGHSLLATQVISRVREVFQIDMPLHTMLEDPTVASIAKSIEISRCIAQDVQSSTSAALENRVQIEI